MKHGGNVYEYQRNKNINLIDIIDFSANINPLGFSEKGMKALMEGLNDIKHYPDPNYKALKSSIEVFEQIESKHIILGNGAIECIFVLAEALKLKSILMLAPTFSEYERAFKKNQTECLFHELTIDQPLLANDLMAYDVEGYIICNPNNPTGQIMAKKELIKLLEFCEKNNRYLIIDEAFIDFSQEESMKTHLNSSQLMILKSVTKFFAIPGLRLGYLLMSNEALKNKINDGRMPWSVNHLVDCYAREALLDTEYIMKTKAYVLCEKKYMMDALAKLEGIKPYKSSGNYIFLKSDNKQIHKSLEDYDILIRDCSNYRNLDQGYFRVAVKSHEDNSYLIKCLKEITEMQNGDN